MSRKRRSIVWRLSTLTVTTSSQRCYLRLLELIARRPGCTSDRAMESCDGTSWVQTKRASGSPNRRGAALGFVSQPSSRAYGVCCTRERPRFVEYLEVVSRRHGTGLGGACGY